jgi:hypothetical protein
VAVEAVAMVGVAVWQESGVLAGQAVRVDVATGTAAYFLVVGIAVAVLAVLVWRGVRGAFGPAVFLQLIGLLLAGTMVAAGWWLGAVVLAGLALGALVVLLSPSGREAFGRV